MRASVTTVATAAVMTIPASAQEVATGAFVRSVSFGPGLGAQRVTQWGVPLLARTDLGRRAAVELATAWASTELASHAGWAHRFTGFTDLQARLSLALGRDVAMVSLTGNVPVGNTPSSADRAATGATASPLLSFPVTHYRSGPAATGAIALASKAGNVNLGFGGAARWAAPFQPVSDAPSRFAPALEGRVHVAADGLAFGGRLSSSLTASSFTTDEIARTGSDPGTPRTFRPGWRGVWAFSYAGPLNRQVLQLGGWILYNRPPRDSVPAVFASEELIASVDAAAVVSLGGVATSPRIAFRTAIRPDGQRDQLFTAEISGRLALGERTRLLAAVRYDVGRMTSVSSGAESGVRGSGMTIGLTRTR